MCIWRCKALIWHDSASSWSHRMTQTRESSSARGVAGRVAGGEAVATEQLNGHPEAGCVITAVFGADSGLEDAGAHRVPRMERVAAAAHRLAA